MKALACAELDRTGGRHCSQGSSVSRVCPARPGPARFSLALRIPVEFNGGGGGDKVFAAGSASARMAEGLLQTTLLLRHHGQKEIFGNKIF